MNWIKRLMEIKEEQLNYEERQDEYLYNIDQTLHDILEELKGGKKKWKK